MPRVSCTLSISRLPFAVLWHWMIEIAPLKTWESRFLPLHRVSSVERWSERVHCDAKWETKYTEHKRLFCVRTSTSWLLCVCQMSDQDFRATWRCTGDCVRWNGCDTKRYNWLCHLVQRNARLVNILTLCNALLWQKAFIKFITFSALRSKRHHNGICSKKRKSNENNCNSFVVIFYRLCCNQNVEYRGYQFFQWFYTDSSDSEVIFVKLRWFLWFPSDSRDSEVT